MIYTVTFNPAIDYVMRIGELKDGLTNRSKEEEINFGGKGVNVSIVLSNLGVKNTALGFIAGFTGDALKENLENRGICADFIRLKKGNTRINVKLKGEKETEINAQGPHIEDDEIEALFEKLNVLKEGDTLVLAGSIPSSLPSDMYEKILERLQNKGIRFVVDASGELLKKVLRFKPFLIKPNNFELEEILGVEIKSDEDIINGAKELQKMGAKNVLVSLGADGAILIDENGGVHKRGVYKGKLVDTVGSGDSMVAGFLYGCETDYETALKIGTAAGGATAFSPSLATKEEILSLIETQG